MALGDLQECDMSDDLTKRGEPDRARINMKEPHEVSYWTKELDVTADELLQATQVAGSTAAAVRQYLSRQKK